MLSRQFRVFFALGRYHWRDLSQRPPRKGLSWPRRPAALAVSPFRIA
jgi:hypothetical protein